jgi:hypothetical protein
MRSINESCNSMKKILAVALALMPVAAFADTLPLDVSSSSTTIAGYVPTAGAAALPIAVAFLGLLVIWRVFKRIAKG